MNSSNANTFLRYTCQDSVLAQSIKTTKMMATFEILTTFKDGHFSKEGHRKNAVSRTSMIGSPLPKSTLFSNLLDYTCIILGQLIWEEIRGYIFNMAIMCPKWTLKKKAALMYLDDYKEVIKFNGHTRKEQHLRSGIPAREWSIGNRT